MRTSYNFHKVASLAKAVSQSWFAPLVAELNLVWNLQADSSDSPNM